MSIELFVFNDAENRLATIEEIERLFLNCHNDGTGRVDLDYKSRRNGIAKDPASAGFSVTIVKAD
ncbi:hypothetical protein [Burkholderia sp. GbtcB21]|uniref:hypothetical protein n=1 Tax=Burkholderia sp. GbtcB21 TaxID=2824766 RepID=UPI001C2F810E|nr:hypothetical protein [Burkholderia sp. GbtcB21]